MLGGWLLDPVGGVALGELNEAPTEPTRRRRLPSVYDEAAGVAGRLVVTDRFGCAGGLVEHGGLVGEFFRSAVGARQLPFAAAVVGDEDRLILVWASEPGRVTLWPTARLGDELVVPRVGGGDAPIVAIAPAPSRHGREQLVAFQLTEPHKVVLVDVAGWSAGIALADVPASMTSEDLLDDAVEVLPGRLGGWDRAVLYGRRSVGEGEVDWRWSRARVREGILRSGMTSGQVVAHSVVGPGGWWAERQDERVIVTCFSSEAQIELPVAARHLCWGRAGQLFVAVGDQVVGYDFSEEFGFSKEFGFSGELEAS